MKEKLVYPIISALIIFGVLITFPQMHDMSMDEMSMDGMSMDAKRTNFISLRDNIQGGMRSQHKYRCCLETPCTYCIEKTPGHGEDAACDCLNDIVNGKHPCGECIGEILEGHGNKYLSEYFAKAIAEEVGEQHIDTLKQIIFEKYGMPVEDQK